MKEVTAHPTVDAYQRTVRPVGSPREAEQSNPPVSGARARSSAKVSISSEARALASGLSTPVDAEKVQGLRAAIAQGTFRVDGERVAHAILNGTRDE
jgi:flagellar biosynthesis anti-sigma factor FlgM